MDENTNPTPAQDDVPVVDVETLNQEPEVAKAAEEKQKEEQAADEDKEGGVGSVYSVPHGSYSAFKAAVNGRGYDIDNYYGWQCWDGAALLWQQFGLPLLTGNGLAIGCWDLKRTQNKGTRFDLVTNVNSLKPGDVVCMRPNHIGFFDGYDGGYMRILGQNQGGAKGPNGGMAFNIVKISKTAFAGAFRLKDWHKPKEGIEMVTMTGLNVIYRFLLGEPTSEYGKTHYLGKVTFDKAYEGVLNSDKYKSKVAKAKTTKEADLNQLPSAIRNALGVS